MGGVRAQVSSWLFAAALLTATIGASSPRAASPTLTDPDAIFVAARKAWASGAYPRYAVYAVVVSFQNGANRVHRTWHATEDLRERIVDLHSVGREQNAPHGINVVVPFLGDVNRARPNDPVGEVKLAADEDYGLAPGDQGLGTAINDRDYEVRLVETLTDAQGPEYHLLLRPLREPEHHRLRELWVDGTTMLPEEAVAVGIGSRPPLTKVNWRVEFTQVQGATYIARETALEPVDYGRDGILTDFTVSFEDLALSGGYRSSVQNRAESTVVYREMDTGDPHVNNAANDIENLLRRGLTPITDNPAALRQLGFQRAYPQIERGYDSTIWERAIVAPQRSRGGLRMLVRQRAFLESTGSGAYK